MSTGPVLALAGPIGGQETEAEDAFLRNALIETLVTCAYVCRGTDRKHAAR